MTTRDKLLELFETNKGIWFSGEEIAQKLCLSRAAVWKAVKNLRKEGYAIDAATNRGYCLSIESDILSPQGIWKYLDQECRDMELTVLPTVTSTNALIREKANQGAAEGDTVIANEQTEGRGRYGRDFFSPSQTGIYLSVLLRPSHYPAHQAVRLTVIGAVAMCEAIEAVSHEKAQIKWVNDIYVREKKVCGILTEASLGIESGVLDYVILGAGINLYPPLDGFPKELEETAGAVFLHTREEVKNRLAAVFLNRFMYYYHRMEETDYREEYRRRNLAVGRQVTVILGEEKRSAFVYGIDDECRLMVKYENGERQSLSYGEIRIRL
ncbi:MAG: biotin--[acetyl-CoA-carboxylase] ligase [Lachnospiraceae bacterium]|nr:biotin--[acetyl-CoA-carboxylase] ligase [Lachnospiraceae bacterium]MDY5701173.1 biotin--[acetyl-CoA-carboxylase] ligase [Lachnospiraceae bacterium]